MSERELPTTVAQRVVIKFLTNENDGPNEIRRRLRAQYRESTLSKTQVKFWHRVSWRKRCHAKHKSMTPKDKHHPREYHSSSRSLELGMGISYGSVQSIKNDLLFQNISG
jgi:hypothetical protein